jgi:hypothetical protein
MALPSTPNYRRFEDDADDLSEWNAEDFAEAWRNEH